MSGLCGFSAHKASIVALHIPQEDPRMAELDRLIAEGKGDKRPVTKPIREPKPVLSPCRNKDFTNRIRTDAGQAFRDGHAAGLNNIHYAVGYEECSAKVILAWRDGWRIGFAKYLAMEQNIREGGRYKDLEAA